MTARGLYLLPPVAQPINAIADTLIERFECRPQLRVLLPSQRAARMLSERLVAKARGALLMPTIGAIESMTTLPQVALELPPALSPMARVFELAPAVAQGLSQLELGPANAERTYALVDSLAALFDEIRREGKKLDCLDDLVEDRLAEHWRLTPGLLENHAA